MRAPGNLADPTHLSRWISQKFQGVEFSKNLLILGFCKRLELVEDRQVQFGLTGDEYHTEVNWQS